MNGPSVTPLARTVLALSGESSWCPASASFPELPCFSYQAPISAIHDSRSGPRNCWPASVIMPSIRYFISRLRLSGQGAPVTPSHSFHERPDHRAFDRFRSLPIRRAAPIAGGGLLGDADRYLLASALSSRRPGHGFPPRRRGGPGGGGLVVGCVRPVVGLDHARADPVHP